jgi:enoyl-CoA hydratase/carnithine racemase
MSESEIGVSIEGHVATLELRRPPNNFIDVELAGELADALEALDRDRGVRAVVLAAAGKHFCAGANLKKRVDDAAAGKPQANQARHLYHEAQRLVQTKKPIIAAVHGSAIGAGLGLALIADFRVTCKEARLAANFTALGYHPGFGLTATLPRLVGHQTARWLMLSGRRVPGEEAVAMGLADRLVAQHEVRSAAQAMAAELAQCGPLAVAATRESLMVDLIPAFRAATEREAFIQMMLRETNDFKEGVRAGFDRRDPVFTGT